MSYRTTWPERYATAVSDVVFARAGRVALWRHEVSADGGVPELGLAPTAFYAERYITALFAGPENIEHRTQAGAIAAGQFSVTTREQLFRDDELVWNNEVYRVESQAVRTTNTQLYRSILKRGAR